MPPLRWRAVSELPEPEALCEVLPVVLHVVLPVVNRPHSSSYRGSVPF